MKIITCFITVLAVSLLGTGCFSPSNTIVTEYDAAGNMIRKTETQKSVIEALTESTKNKTVIAFESGWTAYLSISMATAEDPTPAGKIFAGKADKAVFSIMRDQQNWDGIAKAILATKQDITISATGITNTSSNTKTAKTSP